MGDFYRGVTGNGKGAYNARATQLAAKLERGESLDYYDQADYNKIAAYGSADNKQKIGADK